MTLTGAFISSQMAPILINDKSVITQYNYSDISH